MMSSSYGDTTRIQHLPNIKMMDTIDNKRNDTYFFCRCTYQFNAFDTFELICSIG